MSDKTIVSKCLSIEKNLAKQLPTEENDSNGGKMEKKMIILLEFRVR